MATNGWRAAFSWTRWLMGLLAAFGASAAMAEPMVMLDSRTIEAQALKLQGRAVNGREFQLARPGEPVWVALDLVAETSAGDGGELVIEFGFDGMPIPIMDTVALYRARYMRKVAGQEGDVRRSVVMKLMPTGQWRPGDTTYGTFALKRADGMTLRSLSFVIGQGDPSPELQRAIDQVRGSWFVRYRSVVLMIGAALFFGGVIWWRLLRR